MDGSDVVKPAAGTDNGKRGAGPTAEKEETDVLPNAVVAHPTGIDALDHFVNAIGSLIGVNVTVEGQCLGHIG